MAKAPRFSSWGSALVTFWFRCQADFLTGFARVLYISQIRDFATYTCCKYFLPHVLPFDSFTGVFGCIEILNFYAANFIQFSLDGYCILNPVQKSFPIWRSWGYFLISSFKSFVKCFDYHTEISACMESMLGYHERSRGQVPFFPMSNQLYQNHFSPSMLFRIIFALNQASTYPWPASELITGTL